MRLRLRAVGMAGAAVIAAGCAEEMAEGPPPARPRPGMYASMRATQLASVGVPGPADMPFGEALVTYSHMLADVHAWEREQSDTAIHEATLQLATAIERMPAAGAQPALRRAAAAMRAEADRPGVEAEKRALAAGATEILRLSMSAYQGSPDVLARARAFAGAVDAIDPEIAPLDRAAIVTALVRAERALAAMYAMNVMPP
jgi:hypothetical protein